MEAALETEVDWMLVFKVLVFVLFYCWLSRLLVYLKTALLEEPEPDAAFYLLVALGATGLTKS